MRHLLTRAALAAALLVSPAALAGEASAANYAIDSGHTSVVFKVMHLGVAPFYGMFNKVSGDLDFDPAKPEASRFKVEIDVNSVFTADKKRDDHLRSPDFFSAKQFPTATLESKSVKAGPRADTFIVEADLTIRGVTKAVTLTVTKTGEGKDPWGNLRVGFETTLTIDRMDFGINYMPDGLGKDVTLILAVEGMRKG